MTKLDYEPILAAGRHEINPDDFESIFVEGLGVVSRRAIWARAKKFIVNEIVRLDIKCELWLDGSFITKCPEPSDLDGSLMVTSEVMDLLGGESLNYLTSFDDCTPPFHETLDIYLCQVYPKDHPLHGNHNDPDGWAKQWSTEHNSGWLKGFAVIPFR